MRLVAEAQASGSRAQALADRAAAMLFYIALAAGTITLVVWWLLGDPEGALIRTATVLVIACPHALGLAIPLVIAISTSLGARNGLLVKDRLALERARTLDTVIFDKTGTLTKGEPVLVDVAAGSADVERVLGLAASVEADSEHPLARAIVEGARQRAVETRPATDFEALAGRGAHAMVHGHDVFVGGPRMLADQGLSPHPHAADWDRQGRTVLHVGRRRRRGRHRGRRGRDQARVEGGDRGPAPPRGPGRDDHGRLRSGRRVRGEALGDRRFRRAGAPFR
jgi:Cu2+-exporting ATPase